MRPEQLFHFSSVLKWLHAGILTLLVMCLLSQRFFCCELHCSQGTGYPTKKGSHTKSKPSQECTGQAGEIPSQLNTLVTKGKISISGPTTNDSVCSCQGKLPSPYQSMLSASLTGFQLFLMMRLRLKLSILFLFLWAHHHVKCFGFDPH